MTFFGLKYDHDLENRAAYPHQEFPRLPPRHSFYILSRYDATLTVFVDKHWILVDSFAEYRYNCNVCMLDFYFISELKNIEKKIHVANATVRRLCCSGEGGTPYNGPHQLLIGSCLN